MAGLWIAQDGNMIYGPEGDTGVPELLGVPEVYSGPPRIIPAYSRRMKYLTGTTNEDGTDKYVVLLAETSGFPVEEVSPGNGLRVARMTPADRFIPLEANDEGQLELLTDSIACGPNGIPTDHDDGSGVFNYDPARQNTNHPGRIVLPLARVIDRVTGHTGEYLKMHVAGLIPWGTAIYRGAGIWDYYGFDFAVGCFEVTSSYRYILVYPFEVWWEGKENGDPITLPALFPWKKRFVEFDVEIPIEMCDMVIAAWHSVPKDYSSTPENSPDYEWWNGQPWAQEAWLLERYGSNPTGHGGYSLNFSNVRFEA